MIAATVAEWLTGTLIGAGLGVIVAGTVAWAVLRWEDRHR